MPQREYLNYIDWERVHADVYTLAELVTDSGYRPDVVVGIGQGGIIPATMMYFALPEAEFKIVTPAASTGDFKDPLVGIEGKKVLLLDDLAITGDSLGEIKRKVAALKPREVRTACLYCSLDYKDLDFSVRNLGRHERVVFPWYGRVTREGIHVYKYKGRFGKHEPIE